MLQCLLDGPKWHTLTSWWTSGAFCSYIFVHGQNMVHVWWFLVCCANFTPFISERRWITFINMRKFVFPLLSDKKECWSFYTWETFKLQHLRLERLLNCKLSGRRLYCHNVKSTKMEDWKDQSQGCIPAAIPCNKCEFWYIYFDPIISSCPGWILFFCQIILTFYQSCLCSISEHNSFLQRRLNLLH